MGRYSLFGDADLKGKLTTNDCQFDTGFVGGRSGWRNGDFDYSGAINTSYYFVLDQAFLR
jgi:hypothetical protein